MVSMLARQCLTAVLLPCKRRQPTPRP